MGVPAQQPKEHTHTLRAPLGLGDEGNLHDHIAVGHTEGGGVGGAEVEVVPHHRREVAAKGIQLVH